MRCTDPVLLREPTDPPARLVVSRTRPPAFADDLAQLLLAKLEAAMGSTDAHFFDRDELLALGRSCGPASLRGSLLAPGPIPGLSHLGLALESLAHCVPQIGACQVLVIERMWPTGGR